MYDYGLTLNLTGWILAIFSTTATAARMYTRTKISSSSPGSDDWCMLIAWIFAIVCTAIVSTGTHHGVGKHYWEIQDPHKLSRSLMFVLMAPLFSLASAFFTKASIVLGFMRIMGRTTTVNLKLIAYIPLVFLFIANAVSCSVMIFYCWPVEKAWTPSIDGTCLDPVVLDVVGRTASVYNALMDVFCAVVPAYLITKLNIPRKDKRNLIILMGGCIICTITTVMKIIAMSTISNVQDATHSWSEITIWYLTENHVLIVCGCIPALRPLWRRLRGRYSSSHSSDNEFERREMKADDPATIGGTVRKKSVPGLYSVDMRGVSDETIGKGDESDFDDAKATPRMKKKNIKIRVRDGDVEKGIKGKDGSMAPKMDGPVDER